MSVGKAGDNQVEIRANFGTLASGLWPASRLAGGGPVTLCGAIIEKEQRVVVWSN